MREKEFRGISEHFGMMEYGSDFKLNNVNVGGGEMEQWAFVNGNKIITKTFGEYISHIDSNNRKIFEGDIVKYTSHSGYLLDSFVAEIKWIESLACFGYSKIEIEKNGFYDVFIHPFSEHDEFEIDILPYFEIVGNIHENADLLN